MRILHFSDLHIGVENYGTIDPETGLSSRLLDFLHTYDQVVDYALANDVDLVLFAGDAYKSRDPSQTHQREFARRISRLASEGVPVFLLLGNHDLPNVPARATALEIFPTLQVPHVTVADRLETHRVQTRRGPLQVIALPWVRRSQFLAREETRNLTAEEINRYLEREISRLLLQEIQGLDPDLPALLTAHISLNTARTSSEQSMLLGHDPVLLQSTVAHPAFDYVALGHIHKHQVLSAGHPHVVYSGSLQRIDFGEEHDLKGFCIVDLDPAKPRGERLQQFQFVPVDARPFLTVPVSIDTEEPDPTAAVLRAIQRHEIRGAVVRVAVRIPGELEGQLREAEIRRALADAHYVTPVAREVIRSRRTRLSAALAAVLTPEEALKQYVEESQVPRERAETLLHYGQRLIQEETAET